MIEKQKTTYMRLGLGLAGVVVDDITAEKIWRIYEDLYFKKGDFSMRDVLKIESEVSIKHKRRKIKKGLSDVESRNEF
jgi:hypothetical protein